LGLVTGADLVFVVVYTLLFRRFTPRGLSDALCSSALLVGLVALVPLVVELGRSINLPGRAGGNQEKLRRAMADEQRLRQQGMVITFALIAAAVILAVISFILSVL
jgi:hypothetical protein